MKPGDLIRRTRLRKHSKKYYKLRLFNEESEEDEDYEVGIIIDVAEKAVSEYLKGFVLVYWQDSGEQTWEHVPRIEAICTKRKENSK